MSEMVLLSRLRNCALEQLSRLSGPCSAVCQLHNPGANQLVSQPVASSVKYRSYDKMAKIYFTFCPTLADGAIANPVDTQRTWRRWVELSLHASLKQCLSHGSSAVRRHGHGNP